jgi:hypothetical protein
VKAKRDCRQITLKLGFLLIRLRLIYSQFFSSIEDFAYVQARHLHSPSSCICLEGLTLVFADFLRLGEKRLAWTAARQITELQIRIN